MSSINALKKEVQVLKRALHPDRKRIEIVWTFSRHNEPHGPWGCCRMIVMEGENVGSDISFEPLMYEEEMQIYSRQEYAEMTRQYPQMTEKEEYPCSTFEKWLESHRCRCGRHGEDGKQPFYSIATLSERREAPAHEKQIVQVDEAFETQETGEKPSKTENEEETVVYRDLPQKVILDRKYGIRRFTPQELDEICKEQYGATYARYDTEKDCCRVTFEKVKPKPMEVDLFRMGT
jgi:hypothetical protein